MSYGISLLLFSKILSFILYEIFGTITSRKHLRNEVML